METAGDESMGIDVKKHRSYDADRISNLPDDLLHRIFSSFHPIHVVRTSVLSKRWRYMWVSMPYLDFELKPNQEQVEEKLTNFVKAVLIHRNNSALQRFRLSCPIYRCNSTIYTCLLFASATHRNLQRLDLDFNPQNPFSLPSSLISSKSLTHLKLRLNGGTLILPTSIGFSRLTNLSFDSVNFSDEGLVQQLFSSSPLLENLYIRHCFFAHLHISARNLKTLTISYPSLDFNGHRTEITISAPNLRSFNYNGPLAYDYSFNNLSSLVDVFINKKIPLYYYDDSTFFFEDFNDSLTPTYPHKDDCSRMCKMMRGFYTAEVLTLSMYALEGICFPSRIPGELPIFNNLKTLKLISGVDEYHFMGIAKLLKLSPNLEDLDIEISYVNWGDADWNWNSRERGFTCLTYHLKTIEITYIRGGFNELQFVKFLLKKASVLEKMVITCYQGVKSVKKPGEIIEEILSFPKASSTVAISFPQVRTNIDLSTLLEKF